MIEATEMINLIISDGLGARPTLDQAAPVPHFGTPVAPDGTALQDARNAIEKYQLRGRIPPAIRDFLWNATAREETPKGFGERIHHYVLARPANACVAARRAAEDRGLPACVLTTVLEGESSAAGTFLACIAKEVAWNGQPISAQCLLIVGEIRRVELKEG